MTEENQRIRDVQFSEELGKISISYDGYKDKHLKEISNLSKIYYKDALELIKNNKSSLEEASHILLKKKTLVDNEIIKLFEKTLEK